MPGLEWMLDAATQVVFGILWVHAALAFKVVAGEARREGGRS
jgi:hypothetical protein